MLLLFEDEGKLGVIMGEHVKITDKQVMYPSTYIGELEVGLFLSRPKQRGRAI